MMKYPPKDDVLGTVIAFALGALAVRIMFTQVRYHFRLFRSQHWPIVRGKVQKGETLHAGGGRASYRPWRALLGYAYEVAGQKYWGLFVLVAEDMWAAEKLQKMADDHEVTVRYDPKNPELSFVVERELLGRRVVQDPSWL